MKRIKLFLGVALALMVMVVIVQNAEPVETRFLVWSLSLPRAVLLAATATVGFIVGVLWTLHRVTAEVPDVETRSD